MIETRRPGRPRRNKNKRVQVTVYIDMDLLNKVDDLVEEMQSQGDKTASRSELYHQVMKEWLKKNGEGSD
jgi:uncharacterized protein (DUF4415 family)